MSALNQRLLTRSEAASRLSELGLRTAPATLAKKACHGGGPLMVKYGRRALYREQDLISWAVHSCRYHASTSDRGVAMPDYVGAHA